VGPNGAGKTTMMRILATLLLPTSGEVSFYPNLTALETLEYFALLSEVRRTRSAMLELLDRVGLADAAHRYVGGFSGGMQRRLGLAVALVHDPRVLIVDEPTSGLDPEGRLEVRKIIALLGGERTVLLSTHILPDVEATCTRMAVLHKGKIRFQGTPAELANLARDRVYEVRLPKERVGAFSREHPVITVRYEGDHAFVRTIASGEQGPEDAYRAVEPTVEDGYFFLLSSLALEGGRDDARSS